jgi:hypothetical protein
VVKDSDAILDARLNGKAVAGNTKSHYQEDAGGKK